MERTKCLDSSNSKIFLPRNCGHTLERLTFATGKIIIIYTCNTPIVLNSKNFLWPNQSGGPWQEGEVKCISTM